MIAFTFCYFANYLPVIVIYRLMLSVPLFFFFFFLSKEKCILKFVSLFTAKKDKLLLKDFLSDALDYI